MVEAVVRERQATSVVLEVSDVLEADPGGVLGRLLHPLRLDVDADELHDIGREENRVGAVAATEVEHAHCRPRDVRHGELVA